MRVPDTPKPSRSMACGVFSSAAKNTSNGAPLRIWAYSAPVEPTESNTRCPVSRSNALARRCIGAAKFEATATRTSAAVAMQAAMHAPHATSQRTPLICTDRLAVPK